MPILSVRDPFRTTLEDPNAHLGALHPSLFSSLDGGTEDIHSYVYRTLLSIVRDEPTMRQVAAGYFATVNTWFTIVDQPTFTDSLEAMFMRRSAEIALLVMCMLLITRTPQHTPGGNMQDGLYFSVKAMFALVEARVSLSRDLLRASLLIAMYEHGHSMPQQAYCTLGTCIRMARAFGWYQQSFWSRDPGTAADAAELRVCSTLWWAIVFLDWCVSS